MRCLLVPGESPPQRHVKSKNFIGKLMFLAATARPRFALESGECLFDGKIGIWAFLEYVEAKRNSKNRMAGTIEIKGREVTRETYFEKLVDEVIPAILIRFPDLDKPIVLQQDNATPHICTDDPDFIFASKTQGLDLKLLSQPPSSPDLNINDLGFFRAIDALQQEQVSDNFEELIKNVEQAYFDYCPKKLNKVWISYQQVMIETMKVLGKNTYKLPHMSKDKLDKENKLPVSLKIPLDLVQSTLAEIEKRENIL